MLTWSKSTEGLIYTLINGNAYSVSKGMATAAEVVIPAFHEGLPVTEIAVNGFSNYTNMTGITIPNSVTDIDNYAFNNCTSLTNITIPNSVTNIGNSILSGCTSLTDVAVPFLGPAWAGSHPPTSAIYSALQVTQVSVQFKNPPPMAVVMY